MPRSLLLLFLSAAMAAMAAAQFTPAPGSCSQAHCDSQLSDQGTLAPPLLITKTTYDQTGGANIGLGCSTNNALFACTFQTVPSLVVYDPVGARICTSGNELDTQAYHSAPALDTSGKLVLGDSSHVVMFDATNVTGGLCAVRWRSAALNGSPVSILFDPPNSLAMAATTTGWIYSISTVDGHTVAAASMSDSGHNYLTTNTPCVQGSKIFIVTQRNGGPVSDGRIFGFNTTDLTAAIGFPVAVTGPSFASPVCYGGWVITDDATPAAIWIGQANGTPAAWSPVVLPAPAIASFALDLRNPASVWIAMSNTGFLRQQQVGNGASLGTLAMFDANGIGSVPASALTIVGPPSNPYLIAGLAGGGKTSATMFDLTTKTPVWTVYADSGCNGQFPVLNTATHNVVAFTSKTGGAYFASGPSASSTIRGGVTIRGGAATVR
ncbi:MAG: hypothetical protein ABI693_27945 [Bryobacteraceae bacterium]